MTPPSVLAGLALPQKRLPSHLLYDARGSRLFDAICEQPEYHVTRTELAIIRAHLPEMARFLGPDCVLIEPGAGNGVKTRLLLGALERPAAYVPVDVSPTHLRECARRIRAARPGLAVRPLCADFTAPMAVPPLPAARRAIYFPGSTIGNFEPHAMVALLASFRTLAGAGGRLLIGFDLRRHRDDLERAYDDAAGVTAQFNLNLLERLNREFGANFDPERFRHQSRYDARRGRVEMHLVSRRAQTARVAGRLLALREGESIHTENSYKHEPGMFAALAARAGWRRRHRWCDAHERFSVEGYVAV